MKRQPSASQEGSPYQRIKLVGTLILNFLASTCVGNKISLFKPPNLWYFATAAQADWYTDGVAPVWLRRLENKDYQWCSSSPKASRQVGKKNKNKKQQCPNSHAIRQKKFLLLKRRSDFLLHSCLHLNRRCPPTLERAICIIQYIDSNVNPIQKHPHIKIQHSVWANI